MKELDFDVHYDVTKVAAEAVGTHPDYCTERLPGNGYIVGLKMSADSVEAAEMDIREQVGVARRRCVRNDAYMGQVNLCRCSGYMGPDAALWGYDLARSDASRQPLYLQPQQGAGEVPVYELQPLLEATERLFGTFDRQRFPFLPGTHLTGTQRMAEARGPVWVWSLMAVAIPANRNVAATTILTDAGLFGNGNNNESDMIGFLKGRRSSLTHAIALAGRDQMTVYESLFVGGKYLFVEPECLGCAVACAPEFRLAGRCVPQGMEASALSTLTLPQWEDALGLSTPEA